MKIPLKIGKFLWVWAPPALWTSFIYYMSSLPASSVPRHWMLQNDKLVHVVVFGVLATFVFRALYLQWKKGLWLTALATFLLCSAYGAHDEWHQSTATGRITDVYDWYADVAGSALVFLQAAALQWWQRRKN